MSIFFEFLLDTKNALGYKAQVFTISEGAAPQ